MIVAFIIIKHPTAPDSYVSTDMDNCVRTQTLDEVLELLCRPRKDGCEYRTFEFTNASTPENFCARTLLNIPKELQGRPVLYPVFTELWNFLNK